MGSFKIIAPERATNVFLNPSFELNTTSWFPNGTNTIARSSAQSLFGNYSLLCTYQDSAGLANSTVTVNDSWYRFSMYVWVPSNFNGDGLLLTAVNFTSSTVNQVVTWTNGTDPFEQWIRLESSFRPDAGDLTGAMRLSTSGTAPTAGRTVYTDGAQLEQKLFLTTYVDGDQPDCVWLGAPHASQSRRPWSSYAGGRIYDIEDDLGMYIEQMSGLGFPMVENMVRDRALVDGVEHIRGRVRGAAIRLNSRITGTTLANYHAARRLIVDALAPDPADGFRPILFQYTGGGETRELPVRYAGGLDLAKGGGFHEIASIQLQSSDPYWSQIGEQSAALDIQDTALFRCVGARIDGQWNTLGAPNATTFAQVYKILHDETNGLVYVGGDFTGWDSGNLTGADYIAAWNLADQAWERVGAANALNSRVESMAFDAEGTLILVGNFSNAGGVAAADGVATWDGSSWGALGAPAASGLKDVAVGLDGNVFVCGPSLNIGGDADADGLAVWNGSTWSDVGAFSNLQSYALGVAPNGDIYVGGDWNFSASDGTAFSIARWDGSSWFKLGSGITGGASPTIEDIFVDTNGDVYVGGPFTTAGSTPASNIARWNGSEWFALGSGLGGAVGDNAIARVGDEIIVGGTLPSAGGLSLLTPAAAWDGSSWRPLDIKIQSASVDITAVANVNGALWLGGDFEEWGSSNQYAGKTTITPTGSAKTYPVLSFDWTATDATVRLVSVINETTGSGLYFDYPMLLGEKLTIDLRPGKRNMVSSLFGERWQILPSSDVSDFWIRPNYDNDIMVFVEISGASAVISAFITWENKFWGVD